MKSPTIIVQIAVFSGAIVLGVLLDRLALGAGSSSVKEHRQVAASEKRTAQPGNAASGASSPSATPSAGEVRLDTSPASTSLDSILGQRDQRQRLRETQTFINALASGHYPDALKRIRQITGSNERELASRLLVTQWALNDPDGALQFAASNRGFEYVAEDVFQVFAANDFASAIERAKGMPGNELRYRALRGALGFKADTDPRGALELAQTLGEFRGSEPLTSVVYRQWAATDPQAAALHATAVAEPDEGWRSPVNSVVQTWAGQDPAAAANWALSVADAQAQARSISQVMRRWANADASAAANWIHSLESGAARDAAVAGLAQALVSRDPQTAISWVGTMSDDSTRQSALRRISGSVMWRDPQNGAALLQAAGLPADQIRGNRSGRRDR